MSFSTTTNMVLDPTFAKKPQHFNLRPAEGDQSSAITAARTGKTRRGRRGGRGRSLTPRPGVGVASPAASETGALRKSDAGRWVATSDALGQPVQYHHLLTFPSQHHDRVIDCRTNIGAWGHQVKYTFGPKTYHAQQGAGPTPLNAGNYHRLGESCGSVPTSLEAVPALVERVQFHLGDMASLFSLYRGRGVSMSAVDMEKVEEQLRGVSMLLSQMRLRLIEEHEANSKDGRFSSVAIAGVPRAPSRLPPADDSQGPFGRVSDMATGIRHVPPSEVRGCTGTPTGLGLGLVTEQGIGWSRGAITSGSVSKPGGTPVLEAPATGSCTGIPAEIEIPEHPCQKFPSPQSLAGGSASTLLSGSSADIDIDEEMDGKGKKKKKRRGKRGIRKGKKQLEGFAGFPLAPGLGPEYAGQPRRRLPKAPPLRIMGGEHDLSEFCLQDDDNDANDVNTHQAERADNPRAINTAPSVISKGPDGTIVEEKDGEMAAAVFPGSEVHSERLGRYRHGEDPNGKEEMGGAVDVNEHKEVDEVAGGWFGNDLEGGAVPQNPPGDLPTREPHANDRIDAESQRRGSLVESEGQLCSAYSRLASTSCAPSAAAGDRCPMGRPSTGQAHQHSHGPGPAGRRLARPSPITDFQEENEVIVGGITPALPCFPKTNSMGSISGGKGSVIGPDDDTPKNAGIGHSRPIPWQSQSHGSLLPPTPRVYANEAASVDGAHHADRSAPGAFRVPVVAAFDSLASPPRVVRVPSNPADSCAPSERNGEEKKGATSNLFIPSRCSKATVADVKEAFERADTRVALRRGQYAGAASIGPGKSRCDPDGFEGCSTVTIKSGTFEVDELSATLRQLCVTEASDVVTEQVPTFTGGLVPATNARKPQNPENKSQSPWWGENMFGSGEHRLQDPPMMSTGNAARLPSPAAASRAAGCERHRTNLIEEAVKVIPKTTETPENAWADNPATV